jgi:hypothetical protein
LKKKNQRTFAGDRIFLLNGTTAGHAFFASFFQKGSPS